MVKNLIQYIVNTLVDKPQLATIEEFEAQGKRILEVRVAPHDLPKLIGKEGRVFRAIRSVTQSVSSSNPVDLVVDILKE
jgi:predicted RNA-binding protein YlqC (UPF0109 family)